MNCRDIEELAGAIALGALPADEAASVRVHLAKCADAHQEVGDLTRIAGLLPFACDSLRPPAGLRDSLLKAARFDIEQGSAATAAHAAVDGNEVRPRPTLLHPIPAMDGEPQVTATSGSARWNWTPSILLAAALLVIVLGLGAWNVDLERRLSQPTAAPSSAERVTLAALVSGARIVALQGENGVQATYVQPQQGAATIVGSLPALPAGKAYQAWYIRDNQSMSAGVFHGSGVAVLVLQGNSVDTQALAITIEPEHGSTVPTGPIVAKATLS